MLSEFIAGESRDLLLGERVAVVVHQLGVHLISHRQLKSHGAASHPSVPSVSPVAPQVVYRVLVVENIHGRQRTAGALNVQVEYVHAVTRRCEYPCCGVIGGARVQSHVIEHEDAVMAC